MNTEITKWLKRFPCWHLGKITIMRMVYNWNTRAESALTLPGRVPMSNFSTNIVADNREKWAWGQRLAADCREAKQIFANKHTLCKFLIDHNLHGIFHTFLRFFASFKFKWIKSSHNNIHVSKEALKFTVIGALMTVNMRENTVARPRLVACVLCAV